jgi:Protein kinase domain
MNADAWRQAKSVLAEALVCPPNEREALVLARCPDPSVRRELQSYLNQYDEHFLETVLTVTETFDSTTTGGDDALEIPDIRPGDRIGPYVVVERVGAGGMGRVFLCNDTRLHRKVALKCLIASPSRVDIRSRILHEARAAARITHPNIAVVHDVIEHDGRPFLVMEYVEGESLAAVIKRERLSLERILAIGRQLASALGAAHAKGIIHRDLKPANIQVMPDGSVKVLDFGVAQAMAVAVGNTDDSTTAPMPTALSTTATLRTEKGLLRHPGTPAYMSPEQMFGKPIDQRSDIYSFGIILYEMATGHRPYSTDDPLEVAIALSKNFIRDDEGVLPRGIGDVIAKMLAVDLAKRYQTAFEVESALTGLMAPEPAPAAITGWRSRLRAAGRVLTVGAVIAAGVTALAYLETTGFNSTLGRVAPFDVEPAATWLVLGLRSLLVPLVYLLGIFVIVWAARFVVRVLSLSKHVDRLLHTGMTQTNRLESRLNLDDPAVFGQAASLIGTALLAATMWRFWPFIRAWGTWSIGTQPADRFLALQPTGLPRLDAQLYQIALMVLIYGFGAAVARIRRLRARHTLHRGGTALALVGAISAVAIVMCVYPYRIEWKNDSPRFDVAGERCFRIGQSGEDWLMHCPDRQPPRNRIMKRTDPTLKDTGLVQNIFTPPETLH